MSTTLPPPPPPPSKTQSSRSESHKTKSFGVSSGKLRTPQKIVIYGPGGIGKTELASLISEIGIKALVIDVERGSHHLNVDRIDTIESLQDVRHVLHDDDLLQDYGAVILDSATKVEELICSWVVANVPHEKPEKRIRGIEDYGFGKGLTHIYETFLLVLSDLDALVRRGKHIIVICHECVAEVPNPQGEDWKRYEPRLQSPPSGKASVRLRVKEWCDHLAFIGYDVDVTSAGKGIGSGSRAIYVNETPSCMSKTRTLSGIAPIIYTKGDTTFWDKLLKG